VEFLQYIVERRSDLLIKTAEHLMLVGISATAAVLVSVPLGILITRWSRLRAPVLSVAGVVQTIPSIAMLALLMIPLGLGVKPAIGALILYSLLPIIRNTHTGLTGVDRNIIEAADGMGFTPGQRLWMVELPLAAPVIIAGIRTATVINVGIATLSAYVGAGGLGDFIVRGLSTGNNKSILVGVIVASAMAVLLDLGIGLLENLLKHKLHQK